MSIEITPALLADLRQNAEAAGGGYWQIDYWQIDLNCVVYEQRDGRADTFVVSCEDASAADLAHIAAASPAVVLALVAEVERLRLFQAVAVEVIDKLNNYHECSDPDQCRSCDQINAGIEAISKAKREASNDY